MIVRLTRWRGALPRAALIAACVAIVPLPAGAADRADQGTSAALQTAPISATGPNIQASMNTIVARDLRASRPAPAPRAQQGSNPAAQSPGFFRTRTGAIVAAVMIAGTGYALYSTQHDRIHSPGKE